MRCRVLDGTPVQQIPTKRWDRDWFTPREWFEGLTSTSDARAGQAASRGAHVVERRLCELRVTLVSLQAAPTTETAVPGRLRQSSAKSTRRKSGRNGRAPCDKATQDAVLNELTAKTFRTQLPVGQHVSFGRRNGNAVAWYGLWIRALAGCAGCDTPHKPTRARAKPTGRHL
jgi:hypothetical protein